MLYNTASHSLTRSGTTVQDAQEEPTHNNCGAWYALVFFYFIMLT